MEDLFGEPIEKETPVVQVNNGHKKQGIYICIDLDIPEILETAVCWSKETMSQSEDPLAILERVFQRAIEELKITKNKKFPNAKIKNISVNMDDQFIE